MFFKLVDYLTEQEAKDLPRISENIIEVNTLEIGISKTKFPENGIKAMIICHGEPFSSYIAKRESGAFMMIEFHPQPGTYLVCIISSTKLQEAISLLSDNKDMLNKLIINDLLYMLDSLNAF
jgi:hypothetical protein